MKRILFLFIIILRTIHYTEDEGFRSPWQSFYKQYGFVQILQGFGHSGGTSFASRGKNHRAYYERLKYIRVYAKKFLPPGLARIRSNRSTSFYLKAMKILKQGSGWFSPEGNSYKTGDSPGIFKHGIFRLACMDPQPLIVPLVMANFDKLASRILLSVRLSHIYNGDMGITDKNDRNLPQAVASFNEKYKMGKCSTIREKRFWIWDCPTWKT